MLIEPKVVGTDASVMSWREGMMGPSARAVIGLAYSSQCLRDRRPADSGAWLRRTSRARSSAASARARSTRSRCRGPRHQHTTIGQRHRASDSDRLATVRLRAARPGVRRCTPRRPSSLRRNCQRSSPNAHPAGPGAGLNRVLAIGHDAVKHVVRGVALTDLDHRVAGLAVLPAERHDLRAVRVHGEHLHVVDVLQMLPSARSRCARRASRTASRCATSSASRACDRRRRRCA